MRALAPHFGQAIRLRAHMERERSRFQALEELSDALPFAVLQLDARGKVLEANRRGCEILRASDGLRVVDGRLVAACGVESRALALLIGSATKPAAGATPGGATRISRPSGARPYVVNVFPLHSPRLIGAGEGRPAVLVFVSDPTGLPEAALGRLRELFRLTPTEARICLSLASGEDLTSTAGQVGMSVSTARSHLKHIFSKTEASRQSELVKLLNNALPVRTDS